MYMSRVRIIRDKNGRDKYYNVDTMRHDTEMIQNGEGIFDILEQVAGKVASNWQEKLPKISLLRQKQRPLKKVQNMWEINRPGNRRENLWQIQ